MGSLGIFPENAVEYFVSYYDYYQPEAYVPLAIPISKKDSSVNDEIDKLRHSATSALWSVMMLSLLHLSLVSMGWDLLKNTLIAWLVCVQVLRFLVINCSMTWWISSLNAMTLTFQRGRFRVRGDVVEIFPASVMSMPFESSFRG